eukprot:3851539-Rhodomonas_salina.2
MSRHSSGPSAAAAEAKGSNQGAACLPCSSAVILQPFLCRGRLVILSWCSIRDQCLGDAGPRWVENLRDAEVQLGQLHHKVVQHYVRSVNNVLLPRYRPPPPAHSHLLSLWPARPACMSQSSPRHLHSHGFLTSSFRSGFSVGFEERIERLVSSSTASAFAVGHPQLTPDMIFPGGLHGQHVRGSRRSSARASPGTPLYLEAP